MVKTQNIAIALMCQYPNPTWMEFFSTFIYYHIYMIVNDNTQNYQEKYQREFPNIHFIQLPVETSTDAGFVDPDFQEESLIPWHKALYYFSRQNLDAEHVWFIEDDAFFHSEYTLKNLDTRYHSSDLLCKEPAVTDVPTDSWHWYKIKPDYPLPWYNTMTSVVRVSRTLLTHIGNYVDTHRRLFFVEAMLPTTAKHHQLVCHHPAEFTQIYFQRDFDLRDLGKQALYHPFKDVGSHGMLRELVDVKNKYDAIVNRIQSRRR